ncbi:MAG: acyltransferase domain-containing protein [Acidimicrobiia bacterium]|nr:acyltransferase domain-containing protein [Acidimicrobiia bacterium]
MGAAWVEHPSWELVEEASDVAGSDVARLLLEADADELRLTKNAQLATFLTSLLVLDAVERVGLTPAACAGHSLGEYTALVATGALSFADGVRVVLARGEAMQRAAEDRPGTMAAVLGLDDDDADAACRRADGEVWVANFNGPGQVVVAGTAEAVAAAGVAAKELGARKVLPLPVGGAFHTPLMAPARDGLRKALDGATWHAPDVPVVANVDARAHGGAAEWAPLLSAQLCSPVRWRQGIGRLVADGIDSFVELGPGGVLTGMAKRIVPEAKALAVTTPADLDALLESLAGEPAPTPDTSDGEHLYVTERLVVSPGAGQFRLHQRWHGSDASPRVEVGDVLGTVGGHEVRSLFAGTLMGLLALEGERVTPSQPVAWLRAVG